MLVETTRFGALEIDEKDIFRMTSPLLGFPGLERYFMKDHGGGSPFVWLQSVEDAELAFVILDPILFKPDYEVHLTRGDVDELEIESEDDARVFTLVVVPGGDAKKMTANLQAPLVVNLKRQLAKQVVLNDPDLPIKYPIFGS